MLASRNWSYIFFSSILHVKGSTLSCIIIGSEVSAISFHGCSQSLYDKKHLSSSLTRKKTPVKLCALASIALVVLHKLPSVPYFTDDILLNPDTSSTDGDAKISQLLIRRVVAHVLSLQEHVYLPECGPHSIIPVPALAHQVVDLLGTVVGHR